MQREDLQELHYIAPLANIPSILANGILSNNKAKKMKPESCANEEVQERREKVIVPNGKTLHEYTNLYFNARNPMMYFLKDGHRGLVVLSISSDIIDIPGVVITDCNASRDYVLFRSAPEGLDMIDETMIYAEYWTHQNPIEEYKHKGIMCSEVLVPEKVDVKYINRAYVSCKQSQEALIHLLNTKKVDIDITTSGHLFFLKV